MRLFIHLTTHLGIRIFHTLISFTKQRAQNFNGLVRPLCVHLPDHHGSAKPDCGRGERQGETDYDKGGLSRRGSLSGPFVIG